MMILATSPHFSVFSSRLCRFAAQITLLSLPLQGVSCTKKEQNTDSSQTTSPVSPPPATQQTKPTPPKQAKTPKEIDGSFSVSGEQMIVMPGQGMSAIRFGATPETVRRHMGTDCDQKSENHCLYIDKAVEFFFEEGTLNKILIHRRNHRVPNTKAPIRKFGLFYGYIPPDIRPGLHRKVVLEEFGAPTRVEKLSQPTADGTIEKHYYDGIILSYDRLGNGNIVLSALEVIPSKTAKDPYGVITKKKIEDTPLKKYLEQ